MTSNPSLLRACGLVALICALVPILTDVVSWFLAEDYSPIENSISNLAVGDSSWLMDLGLWFFVLACLAVAVGLWAWRLRAKWWLPAILSLVLLAACVGIVARVNQYAGTGNSGANIHLWAVCGVGVFFLGAAWLSVPGFRLVSGTLARFSMAVGGIWIVVAPLYWFAVPDGWSGAVERLLALVMIGWIVVVARRMRQSGQRAG